MYRVYTRLTRVLRDAYHKLLYCIRILYVILNITSYINWFFFQQLACCQSFFGKRITQNFVVVERWEGILDATAGPGENRGLSPRKAAAWPDEPVRRDQAAARNT